MSPLIYLVASGQMFFVGLGLLATAVVMATLAGGGWIVSRLSLLLILIGVIALAVSATPVHWLTIVLLVAAMGAWMYSLKTEMRQRSALAMLLIVVALAAIDEARWHLLPKIETAAARSVLVIGDSVTAGTGAGDRSIRWPQLIADKHGLMAVMVWEILQLAFETN